MSALYAPAAFTPRKYSWYSFLLEAESTPVPYCDRKDFMSMKNSLALAGIETATFRFVAPPRGPIRFVARLLTEIPRVSEWLQHALLKTEKKKGKW